MLSYDKFEALVLVTPSFMLGVNGICAACAGGSICGRAFDAIVGGAFVIAAGIALRGRMRNINRKRALEALERGP